MSKPIIITEKSWAKLHKKLAHDYPSSVLLIREKMKVVLGFTVRRHRVWDKDKENFYPKYSICLDFYNESKRTWFLLKYSDYLN